MKIAICILVVCVILYAIILFLTHPGSNKKVYDYQWLFQTPIAHRGYHLNNNKIPENSKEAYEFAINQGYNIEIDLNLTKDNRIVVFHDGDVKRMCGIDQKVHDLTLQELKELPLKGGESHMMELQEFLDFVDGRVGVLIEYKGEGKEIDRVLCEESMKLLSSYQGKWVMQSFQPSILAWFKKYHSEVPRGQLSLKYIVEKGDKSSKNHSAISRWMFTNHLSNFIGRPNFMSRHYCDINFMTKFVHLDAKLLIWTVNTVDDFKKYRKYADNVIFEYLNLDTNGKLKK